MTKIEYRVLWAEFIGGRIIPRTGRVYDNFEDVNAEYNNRRGAHNMHAAFIQAREASTEPWITPWEELEDMKK